MRLQALVSCVLSAGTGRLALHFRSERLGLSEAEHDALEASTNNTPLSRATFVRTELYEQDILSVQCYQEIQIKIKGSLGDLCMHVYACVCAYVTVCTCVHVHVQACVRLCTYYLCI